jgi:hypothetical protein
LVKEKARLLESNRASGTAHGGRRIYLRFRPLDAVFLPPPDPRDFDDPFGLAPPRLAEAFRAPAFLAPPFLPPAFFAFFVPPELALAALRAPEDFLPPLLACFRTPALDALPADR